jgi:hypothetical protein
MHDAAPLPKVAAITAISTATLIPWPKSRKAMEGAQQLFPTIVSHHCITECWGLL